MSFIEMPLGDAQEKEVLPEGEYELVIDDFTPQEDGAIAYRLHVEGEPNAKAVFHRINPLKPDDDAEKRNNKLLFNRAFLDKFDIPYQADGFEPSDATGQSARCLLTQETYNDVTSNRIKLAI